MDQGKAKHLEIILEVISRMAHNSFQLKGWTITLLAGLFIISTLSQLKLILLVIAIPTIAFWGLDSYYLRQERLFRVLFEEARRSYFESESDFSIFSMNTMPYQKLVDSWGKTIFSKTEFWFYMPIILVAILIYIFI